MPKTVLCFHPCISRSLFQLTPPHISHAWPLGAHEGRTWGPISEGGVGTETGWWQSLRRVGLLGRPQKLVFVFFRFQERICTIVDLLSGTVAFPGRAAAPSGPPISVPLRPSSRIRPHPVPICPPRVTRVRGALPSQRRAAGWRCVDTNGRPPLPSGPSKAIGIGSVICAQIEAR